MPTHPDFADYCAELLADVGTVRSTRMFGGYGLYVDDLFVAIVLGNSLYLKTDGETQGRFAAAGCVQFSYTARGKQQTLGFWTAPTDAMDSQL